MIIPFHGVITKMLLDGGRGKDAGNVPGRGYVHKWMYVNTSVWMRAGTPCTYIAAEDVDHVASVNAGEIKRQMKLFSLPGHLKGTVPVEEAINEIVRIHFYNSIIERDWLINLTQDGRAILNENVKTCTCDIKQLMSGGCNCGAIK